MREGLDHLKWVFIRNVKLCCGGFDARYPALMKLKCEHLEGCLQCLKRHGDLLTEKHLPFIFEMINANLFLPPRISGDDSNARENDHYDKQSNSMFRVVLSSDNDLIIEEHTSDSDNSGSDKSDSPEYGELDFYQYVHCVV